MIRDSISSALSIMAGLISPKKDSWSLDPMGSLWQNQWTGLGGTSKDRMSAHVPTGFTRLQSATLESLYYGDFLARKIVATLVDEAFRQGFSIEYVGDLERSAMMADDISSKCEILSLKDKSRQAAKLGRLLGGAGLIVGVNGGEDIEEPLEDDRVRSVDSLTIIDARELTIFEYQLPIGAQYFAEHALYSPSSSELSHLKLHATRLVQFGGMETPRRDRKLYFDGWDTSVLQSVWEVLRGFHSNRQSVAAMLQDGSQGVLKLKDLWRTIAENGRAVLDTRMGVIQEGRWSGRIMPISTDEDFQWIERSYGSIPQLLQEDQALVAAAADMPITLLFGKSPAGQNSTGEHDAKNWHAQVESWQKNRFSPSINRVVQLVARELGAQDPDMFQISWPNLEQLSLKERADLEKAHAETDNIRISQGIPKESVLLHRYSGHQYNDLPPRVTEEDLEKKEEPFPKEKQLPPDEPDDEPDDEPKKDRKKGLTKYV